MKTFLVGLTAAAIVLSSSASFAGPGVSGAGLKFGAGPSGWVWGVFGCSGGLIVTAIIANWQQHRQLTLNEAATCGVLYWFTPPKRN